MGFDSLWARVQRVQRVPLGMSPAAYDAPVSVTSRSAIIFPLRSNAHALLAGAPVGAVRGRLKLAALFYDRLLVEEGVWSVSAGPGGTFAMWTPRVIGEEPSWQTSRDRHAQRGAEFALAIGPSGAPDPPQLVLKSPTTIGWRATFEPMKRELPHAYDWLEFGHASDSSDARRLASRFRMEDERDESVRALYPEVFVRDRVIDDANLDLLMGGDLTAAVSMDGLHARILGARIERGAAHPAFGPSALHLLVPKVAQLDWEVISELRGHRGIREYRTVLAEVEALAWEGVTSAEQLGLLVHREYAARLREAQAQVLGSWTGTLVSTAVGLVIGEAASVALGVPVVGGLVGGAAGVAVDASLRRPPPWLAADAAVRRRADRTAA